MATIVCFLTDLSGYITSIKRAIWKWVFGNTKPFQEFDLKPFDCSLCMTHHILLLYLLFTCQFSIVTYFIVCLLSLLSSNITSMLLLFKDFLIMIENKLSNLISKI